MLGALVRFSIRFHGVVILLALVIMIYGSYRFITAGLDIFPEFSPKQVIIQTESAGFSSEQVEVLVTRQIETAISGLIGLMNVRSESIQGLSVVTATFAESSDVYRNRQWVSERLAGISTRLPPGIVPAVIPLSSSSATVLTLGLTSDHANLMDLRSLVDWTIVPKLLSVPGVADVNVFGGLVRQLQIQVNPVQLYRFNLSFDDIIQAAAQANATQGSGFIENQNQRFTLQVNNGRLTPDQLGKVIVRRENGLNVTLGDVAKIEYAPEPFIGAAQIMGKTGIVMMVIGQYGANTLSVTREVERTLGDLKQLFDQQQITFYPHLFRPADYIERSLSNLSGHLIIGGFFVLIILYLFLFNFQSALISALAIPVSLMSAVIILLEAGINLNVMVLGGLAIALGEVVDDAIIDTENIFRRLRENSLLASPRPIDDIIFTASLEVRGSVVYASFIVALVFVPLLTLPGVAGRLFAPLGYSYILAILASLLVALTLTPALCHALFQKQTLRISEPPLLKKITPYYQRLLQWVFGKLNWAIALSFLCCVLGLFALANVKSQFLPELREGHYIVHTSSIPGTSLQESIRIGKQLTQQLRRIDGIESVSQWAGRAERGADTYGSHYSEYELRLKPLPGREQQNVLNQIRAILANFPGIAYEANTFLTERIDETISGFTSAVVVNIVGNNFSQLDAKARHIESILNDMEGAADVQVRSPPATPMFEITLDFEQLRLWGIMPKTVLDTLQAAYETKIVGLQWQGNQLYHMAVALEPELRTEPEAIGQLPLRTEDGKLIQLMQVADIRSTDSRYNIMHLGAQRRQTVTCNILGRDQEEFVKELKSRALNGAAQNDNSYLEFRGAALEESKARMDLIVHSCLAGLGVLIFLYLAMRNVRHVILTLCNLPFALIGGIAAVLLTKNGLSVGSLVGFVTLFGITVRNSIMLVSHYRHLVEFEGMEWSLATAIQGAQERLPSILMTALVTAFAMFPIAFNSDNPGREIMGPMAAIIIGGLVSSTALNLLLLPGILLKLGRFNPVPKPVRSDTNLSISSPSNGTSREN